MNFEEFSDAEKVRVLDTLRRTKPETPDELHSYIKLFFGLDFCRDKVCPDHDPEFDYISHSFFKEEDCVVLANRGGGKCIRGDIMMGNGDYKKVQDVHRGDDVAVFFNDRIKSGKVTNAWFSGEKKCVKIITTRGLEVECSLNHKFWDGKWTQAKDLKTGNFIATSRRGLFGDESYNKKYLKMIGYLIGDGSLSGPGIKFSCANKEILNDFRLLSGKIKVVHYDRCDYGINTKDDPKFLSELRRLNLKGKRSWEKRIPSDFFRLKRNLISILLNALYSTDGWIVVTDRVEIGYSSASKGLSQDIQRLLLKFGIVARLHKKKTPRRDAYVLSIKDWRHCLIFCQGIGITGRGNKIQKAIKLLRKKKLNGGKDIIPKDIIKSLIGIKQLPWKDKNYNNLHRLKSNLYRVCSRDAVFRRARDLNLIKLINLSTNDFFWDEIKSIESIGMQPCWDIEVDKDHEFICEDFKVHNTESGGTATVLDSIFKVPCETKILGGSIDQSEKMYLYTLDKWEKPGFREFLAREPMKRQTILKNRNKFSILTQSTRSVRSARVQKFRCDEVDEYDPKVWRAIPFCTRSEGETSGTLEILSTMHKAGGIMSHAIGRAQEEGQRIFKWCLLDVLEPCGPEYKCRECALREDCNGMAKRKKSGFYKIKDAQRAKMRSDDDSWQIEMLLKVPDFRDSMFPNYSERPAGHLVDDFYNPSYRNYRGFDFGVSTDPFVCLWAQLDSDDNLYIIDEIWKVGMAPSDAVELLVKEEQKRGYQNFFGSFCEPAAAHWRAEFSKKGIFTTIKGCKIEPGVSRIRERLKRNFHTKQPKLFISKRCKNLREEIKAYDKKKHNRGIDNHGLDALRYLCVHLPLQDMFAYKNSGPGFLRNKEKLVNFKRDFKPKMDKFVPKLKERFEKWSK